MRKIFLLSAIASIVFFTSCKPKANLNTTTNTTSSTAQAEVIDLSATDRKDIMAKEVSTWEFGKTKNLPAMRANMADDYLAFFGDKIYDAQEVLATFQNNIVKSYRVYNIHVHPVTNDVAIVYYELDQDITDADGAKWAPHVGASSTYVKRGGKWLNTYYQESVIMD